MVDFGTGYTSPADICQLTAQACLGDLFPFDDDAACIAFFTAQPELCVSGPALQGSSAACRNLHLWNAFNDPATHCPHQCRNQTFQGIVGADRRDDTAE